MTTLRGTRTIKGLILKDCACRARLTGVRIAQERDFTAIQDEAGRVIILAGDDPLSRDGHHSAMCVLHATVASAASQNFRKIHTPP